jgi:ribosomal protein L35
MAMKTNKSYSKRLKVTKTGKILARKAGQNHFNAKESRRRNQLRKKRSDNFVISNKSKSKFLVNI